MRLSELCPAFLSAGGPGIKDSAGQPVPVTEGVGVRLQCPCGDRSELHELFVPFANPLGNGPPVHEHGWQRTGDSFETLTLTPSIRRIGGCGWHGFITNGEVITAP